MSPLLEKFAEEAEKRGERRGERRGKRRGILKQAQDTARRMLAKGKFTYEEIAEYAQLPLESVEALAKG